MTVFWHGDVTRASLQKIVADAEHLLSPVGSVGTLIAYGPSRESVGPIDHGLADYLEPDCPIAGFDAFRAEFESQGSELVVWANVREAPVQKLEEMGENIGICVTLDLFRAAGPLIIDAISSTSSVPEPSAEAALNSISVEVLHSH